VVAAVSVPVTLKIRTGWDASSRNGVAIARLAERCGVQALAVHGRTRADFYEGAAEYQTIRLIKSAVRIPVLANGDIDGVAKARAVLELTGADGVMIGRASHGAPWIFRALAAHFRETHEPAAHGAFLPPLSRAQVRAIILGHLDSLYAFYGEDTGVRIARKHLGWYSGRLDRLAHARRIWMGAGNTVTQFALTKNYLDEWVDGAPGPCGELT
jgi:tRNA-dihydrouridine synthase B